MSQFLLLLYADPSGWAKLSPEEMQKATQRYMEWTQKPITKDSQRLGDDAGKVIRTVNGKPRVTDGPYSQSKEVLAGYYLIGAANYDEAVKLALEHPHVEYGNAVEIRELRKM